MKEITSLPNSLSRLTCLCMELTGEEKKKINLKNNENKPKNQNLHDRGGSFFDPPGSSRNKCFFMIPWSAMYRLHDRGGRFLTPPDRQAPTSYKKGSSRNKCFFMIRGGRFLTPPDRQDFATGDISIIFPKVEALKWNPRACDPGFLKTFALWKFCAKKF